MGIHRCFRRMFISRFDRSGTRIWLRCSKIIASWFGWIDDRRDAGGCHVNLRCIYGACLRIIHPKYLYSLLTAQHITEGQYVNKAMKHWSETGQINFSLMFNVFDSLAFNAFPELNEYWDRFKQAGAGNLHIAGSGPTLYTYVESESQAKTLCQHLCDQGLSAFSVSTTV